MRALFLTSAVALGLLSACVALSPKVAGSGDAAARGGRSGGTPAFNPSEVTSRVTNPRSGVELAVYMDTPSGPGPHPLVLLVPGGTGHAKNTIGETQIDAFLAAGIAVARFDPDGRGNSSGEEDRNGAVQQAGLRALVSHLDELSSVSEVGVISTSFGVAMASGALRGETSAVFYIDWEGPSSRQYIARCSAGQSTGSIDLFADVRCDDEAFWSEREAADFIDDLNIPYLRAQGADDHVHGDDRGHALEMLDAATAGQVPWIRLNDGPLGAKNAETVQLPAEGPDQMAPRFVGWAEEMFQIARGL